MNHTFGYKDRNPIRFSDDVSVLPPSCMDMHADQDDLSNDETDDIKVKFTDFEQ